MARVGLQRLWIFGRWAICQWSRSKVWGRRAHPIPSEVQRGAGGSRTGQPVRAGDGLQEEEIGDGDWRCLSALQHGAGGWTPVGTILAGPASVACRSPDSVWETQISASTSRQTPCRGPQPKEKWSAAAIGTTHSGCCRPPTPTCCTVCPNPGPRRIAGASPTSSLRVWSRTRKQVHNPESSRGSSGRRACALLLSVV